MKVLVDKAALDALLKSATPFHEGSTKAIAEELQLDDLAGEAVAVAVRKQGRTRKPRSEPIDPLDQLATIVLGVAESTNRRLKSEVMASNTVMQVYLRAVLHTAMRAGILDRVTAAFQAKQAAADAERIE
jgi:hypothetical protein